MKSILKKIYRGLFNLKNQLKWYIEYKMYKKNIMKKNNNESKVKGKKMILIPHSDDEWIGCSQVISHACKNEIILCNMDMPGRDSTEIHAIRYKELYKTAEKYNLKLYNISKNKTEQLKGIINKEKPDAIFLPFLIDWHEEHIDVAQILSEAIEKIQYQDIQICMYQVSVPIPQEEINVILPMNKKQVKEKWSFFKKNYQTQLIIPYKRFFYNERINGNLIDTYAAEVYSVKKANLWIKKQEKWKITDSEKETLITNINSISKVRRELQKVYERIENE